MSQELQRAAQKLITGRRRCPGKLYAWTSIGVSIDGGSPKRMIKGYPYFRIPLYTEINVLYTCINGATTYIRLYFEAPNSRGSIVWCNVVQPILETTPVVGQKK